MMANAMRDPLFLAALDVANNDVAGVGDWCLRCHTPDGWYGGRVVKGGNNDPQRGAAGCLLKGSYDSPDMDSDYGGLGCHFCHRMTPEGPGAAPVPGNGAVWLHDAPCENNSGGGPCRFGPYSYDSGAQPPHEWTHSGFLSDSSTCGACHDVASPETGSGPLKTLKLADGSDSGIAYPIERTFSEWQRSAHANPRSGSSCQDCHMPQSHDPDASACTMGGFPNRSGSLATHQFAGGNTWLPLIVAGEFSDTTHVPGSAGGIGRQESFAQTVEWARHMLHSAAQLETSLQDASPDSLALRIRVTNLSGHKLPTGYGEGRRMWLNVQVRDADGRLIAESAAYDADTAELGHDAQARVYEVLQGIFDHNGDGKCDAHDGQGRAMFHFVLNDCIAKDNRIPPLGFQPASATDPHGHELGPVAASYPQTSPGSGILVNHDDVDYSFDVAPEASRPLIATARLYYQTASREYIEFLRRQAMENSFPGENMMCAGEAQRPFTVGPQQRTRGQYMYELWNGQEAQQRIFADGFDGTLPQAGYGKSPPELMQTAVLFIP